MRLLVVLATFVGAGVLAGPALGGTTIGQTNVPNRSCGVDAVVQRSVATGTSFEVPPGQWRVTSWSFQTIGIAIGPVAALIFRPTGAHTYKVVGASAVETPRPNSLNTFPTSIDVRGGDYLGLYSGAGLVACSIAGGPGDSYDLGGVAAEPSVGDSLALPGPFNGDRIDISATLESPDDLGSHEFVCYSKWEQDGGMVVSSSLAAALVSSGGWLPVALPGNVAGGDNLGAYHLACNPPATSTPTGQYVGDGGDVVDAWQDGYYAIDS